MMTLSPGPAHLFMVRLGAETLHPCRTPPNQCGQMKKRTSDFFGFQAGSCALFQVPLRCCLPSPSAGIQEPSSTTDALILHLTACEVQPTNITCTAGPAGHTLPGRDLIWRSSVFRQGGHLLPGRRQRRYREVPNRMTSHPGLHRADLIWHPKSGKLENP